MRYYDDFVENYVKFDCVELNCDCYWLEGWCGLIVVEMKCCWLILGFVVDGLIVNLIDCLMKWLLILLDCDCGIDSFIVWLGNELNYLSVWLRVGNQVLWKKKWIFNKPLEKWKWELN